ncbi:hypothetical protein [Vibrio barjaei]|uniref:hypothetical protein n=1 Tax=Vibrio barjaei TaxID=1676683 RepID=UPI002284BABF|nr:hypothetical protein [Vibrio barjaei]MCY9874049.1 hypothetical protein [Vibrio barjaei]
MENANMITVGQRVELELQNRLGFGADKITLEEIHGEPSIKTMADYPTLFDYYNERPTGEQLALIIDDKIHYLTVRTISDKVTEVVYMDTIDELMAQHSDTPPHVWLEAQLQINILKDSIDRTPYQNHYKAIEKLEELFRTESITLNKEMDLRPPAIQFIDSGTIDDTPYIELICRNENTLKAIQTCNLISEARAIETNDIQLNELTNQATAKAKAVVNTVYNEPATH